MPTDAVTHYTTKINKLMLEGLANSIVKLFFIGKAKKFFKDVDKIAKDDPEVKAALAGLDWNLDHIDDLTSDLCKRNPDHPFCKSRTERERKRRK